ncbi:MAG: cation:proton antiporter [Bdellovibrionales bacterium]|nr:cation:proton antiporter [Bdellovibrionales bacterium]
MIHLPPLIQDLGFLLLTGGLVALLFSFLRQPVIVGYLIAGFLIGPNFQYFPHVSEADGIRLWGEIGVIFLLFGLGLEFSFKKLLAMGPASLVAASIEVIGLLAFGTWVAGMVGFDGKAALFFGGMLAISSTTMLLRALDETGTRSARFAENVLGILIVEDLYAVLLLVLLTTASATEAVFGTLFRFGFFLIVAFVVGVSLLPGLIRKTQRWLSDEMRLVLSLGLCFMAVVLASNLGFSPTLGAFVMGSLLAGTREAKRIERLLHPVQQLFAAVFFVSVGMQIEPSALAESPGAAAAFLGVVVVGKTILVSLGSLVAGKPLKPAIRSGVSMAQIGEFSFIIAGLGITKGVLTAEASSLIVMVATVTAFTTPYAVRNSKAIATFVDERLPKKVRAMLVRYSDSVQRGRAVPEWRKMLSRQALIILVNAALIGAIGLLFTKAANPWVAARFGWGKGPRLGALGAAILFSAPFFWGVAKGGIRPSRFREYWLNRQFRPLLVLFMLARAVVFFMLAGFVVSRFFHLHPAALSAACIAGASLIVFSGRVERTYERFVQRFLLSLSESERREAEERPEPEGPALAPWEGHLAVFEVSFDSLAAGKTFAEVQIRERYGVSVTLIERGDRRIPVPSRNERIFPRDRLHAIGTDEELSAFREFIEVPASNLEEAADSNFSLESVPVGPESSFAGRSIRECGIRERANGLVVGIERKGERILNPPADFRIVPGDLLWIVGQTRKVRAL